MEKSYVRIYKSGNGQAISIKKSTLNQAGFEVGDKLEVNVKSGQLVLEKPNTFKDKWRDFVDNGGTYEGKEYDWGTPVGREVW